MAKKRAREPQSLAHGTVVQLAGGRLAEWNSFAEEGTTYRTEHFRCIDTLGTMLRNGSITQEMHDAGQEGELQASEKLAQAAEMLGRQPGAMQLRYMQTLAGIASDKTSTIVFPLPVDLLTAITQKLKS